MVRPDYNVKLIAVAGYGLTNNYARFLEIKDSIRPNDIVVIGHADYYDIRNVAAPSRLIEIDESLKSLYPRGIPPRQDEFTPKAELDVDRLTITLFEQNCEVVADYCKQPDPPQSYVAGRGFLLIT